MKAKQEEMYLCDYNLPTQVQIGFLHLNNKKWRKRQNDKS